MFQGSFTTWAHVAVFAKTEKNASRKYLWVNYGLKIVGKGRASHTQVSRTTTTSAYRHAQAVRCTADVKCPPRNVGSVGFTSTYVPIFKAKWLRGCDRPAVTPAHLRCIAQRCTLHCTLHAARCCGSRRLATDGKTGPGQRSGRGWNVHPFDRRRRRRARTAFFRRRVFVLLWPPPAQNTIVVQSIRQSHSKMTSTHLSRPVRTYPR